MKSGSNINMISGRCVQHTADLAVYAPGALWEEMKAKDVMKSAVSLRSDGLVVLVNPFHCGMSRVSRGGPRFWLALGSLSGRDLEVVLARGLDVLSMSTTQHKHTDRHPFLRE